MEKRNKVGIIGAGGWGLALANIASINNEVTVWVYEQPELEALTKHRESKTFLPGIKYDKAIQFTGSYEEAAKDKDIIIMVTPSFAYRAAAEGIAPFIDKRTIIVSATKGLEVGTTRTMSEVARDVLPRGIKVLTLSGPSHAEEVGRLVPTAVVIAGSDLKLARRVRDILMTPPHFRVYTSNDQKGVEFGGSLKNIIAIAAGVCDGLKLGDNPRAALITRGLAEIVRFGRSHGANPKTFFGLSGVGDLIVTCASVHSRNHHVGELIAQGKDYEDIKKSMKQVAEGVYAAKAIHEYAKKHKVVMPITESVYRVLFEKANARDEVMALMSRDAKEE
ncbi:MAG: NAD(P)-dependent glycerol-3-phosphate dehydrogenase [Spirochaetes bacterium]|nr:NAD(P)-dependent glycerol-3-phosphate dehydrogenase [Spirochaetota bacterium]